MWRTGKEKNKIVVICRSREEKERVMKNKKKLETQRIFIDNDLTWKERRVKENVLEKAREVKPGGARENRWFRKEKRSSGTESQIQMLRRKNRGCWEEIKKCEVIGMTETWEETDEWSKEKFDGYEYKCERAEREHMKGRASGGMIILATKKNDTCD